MVEEQKKIDLNSWDDFTGEYLKPENVKVFPFQIVPVNVFGEYDEKENKNKLSMEFLFNGRDRKMGLNKTNQDVIRQAKLTPLQIVGKKLTIDKWKVRNPATNQMQDSFIITKIE